jgi:hypothetical protein
MLIWLRIVITAVFVNISSASRQPVALPNDDFRFVAAHGKLNLIFDYLNFNAIFYRFTFNSQTLL